MITDRVEAVLTFLMDPELDWEGRGGRGTSLRFPRSEERRALSPLLLKTFLPGPLLGLPSLPPPLTGPDVGLDGDRVVPASQQYRVVKTPVEQVGSSR